MPNFGDQKPGQLEMSEMNKDLWRQGRLASYEWATGTQRAFIVPHNPKFVGGMFWIREVHSKDVYDGPEDEWRNVWKKIAGFLSLSGKYKRPAQGIESWLRFEGEPIHNESGNLDLWPSVASKLKTGKLSNGLLAVRGFQEKAASAPGLTVVVDQMKLKGEVSHVDFALNMITSGAFVKQQEGDDQWLIFKVIYAPTIYVAVGKNAFGIDWKQWQKGPVDENETRRIWSERTGVMAQMLRSNRAVDSVFFDEYVVCEAVEKLSVADRKKLGEATSECLAATLGQIQEKATLN